LQTARFAAVISESSGYPITKKFLKQMQKHWFDESVSLDRGDLFES
jgi:hypothetical protein